MVHAAWGGAPATAAWILSRLLGLRYSAAAHAYDIYEHGGDWWLNEKLVEARFIHTSTQMGKDSLVARGLRSDRIQVIRRGIDVFPDCRPLRQDRTTLHLICVARLVEKKGLFHQLNIYAALRDAGVSYTAHIVGDGPLRETLQARINELELASHVRLTGHLSQTEVGRELHWADALLHTGVVAASGDRDGLPNVIPEAMMTGVWVLTSPVAATTEAVTDNVTGWVLPVEETSRWVERLSALQDPDPQWDRVRLAARMWTEENYDGHKNAARLAQLFREALLP
jgi:glycosyltransferase involved in cell wall biosynthesis